MRVKTSPTYQQAVTEGSPIPVMNDPRFLRLDCPLSWGVPAEGAGLHELIIQLEGMTSSVAAAPTLRHL